jgi:hypothetical protein
VLAREAGDAAGAAALGTEIARWAGAIGAVRLQQRALAFLAGADITAAPTWTADDPATGAGAVADNHPTADPAAARTAAAPQSVTTGSPAET